jgi:protocatechuate 3,4-dioxygenase, alpha subunit
MTLRASTSQTVGPFFSIGMERLNCSELAAPGVPGERVTIEGRVADADGVGVPDAVIELWQANSQGKYAHPEDFQEKPVDAGFQGFGRIATDEDGKFRFTTIKPGPVPGPDGKLQAPHIAVSVFARGLLRRLVTRIYFPDEPGNGADFALKLVDAARRGTLIARKTPGVDGSLKWDVVLSGPGETVFFDC